MNEERTVISRLDWLEEGTKLFDGTKFRTWKFKCARCGEVQTMEDFVAAGIEPEDAQNRVYQECIGRHVKDRGCDWALYGLFQIHTKEVETEEGKMIPVFEFAS